MGVLMRGVKIVMVLYLTALAGAIWSGWMEKAHRAPTEAVQGH